MTLHFTSGAAFDSAGNLPAAAFGFNLVDLQTVDEVNALPAGDKALIWLDESKGVTASFIAKVTPLLNNPKVFGFYLTDEPDPTGVYKTKTSAADLKAESDYIHAHFPGAKTFITLMDMGSSAHPSYAGSYTTANTGIDLFGVSAYPVWSDTKTNPDYAMVQREFDAAVASGIAPSQIVPVFQAFGGGNWVTNDGSSYATPTAAQEQAILDAWAKLAPNPVFDYTYSWSSQNGDTGLSTLTDLQKVLAAHNGVATGVTTTPGAGTTGSAGTTIPATGSTSGGSSAGSSTTGTSTTTTKPSSGGSATGTTSTGTSATTSGQGTATSGAANTGRHHHHNAAAAAAAQTTTAASTPLAAKTPSAASMALAATPLPTFEGAQTAVAETDTAATTRSPSVSTQSQDGTHATDVAGILSHHGHHGSHTTVV